MVDTCCVLAKFLPRRRRTPENERKKDEPTATATHSQPQPQPRSTRRVCARARVFVRMFVRVIVHVFVNVIVHVFVCVCACACVCVCLCVLGCCCLCAHVCLCVLGCCCLCAHELCMYVSPCVPTQRLHLLAKHTKSLLRTPCLKARTGSPGAEDSVRVIVLVHREVVEELRAAHVDGLLVLGDDHVDDRRQLVNAKTGGEVRVDDLGKRDLRILGGGLAEELVSRVFLLAVLDASVSALLEKPNYSFVLLGLADQAVKRALVLYVHALCRVGIVILAADVCLGALRRLSLLWDLMDGAAAADVDTPLEVDDILGADGRDGCGQRGCDDEKSGSLHGLRL